MRAARDHVTTLAVNKCDLPRFRRLMKPNESNAAAFARLLALAEGKRPPFCPRPRGSGPSDAREEHQ
jgi:hypothetical protein